MERKFLKPNAFAPVPLSENFWRVLVSTGDDESSPAVGSSQAAIRADNVEAEVRRVLHEKRNVVDDAVLKQVAPTATNVVGNQYENLIELSFDQEKLIQEEEERRRRQREKIVNRILT
ncbi:unnamed protein product [Enterobius vermicularis]|uniref:PWI domain-containing protein n=1 Tax=Enterobius vermicularis TaxID=51028 RepID=A0A0N4V546_ENTVE|nr:unnamed protein product [Enterobius vermicularis]